MAPKDRGEFQERLLDARAGKGGSLRTVGYFRSNTRDEMRLATEDLDLCSEFFPDAKDIALLIKPYATRPSTAGLFFRQHGEFSEAGPVLEFPFRRRALDPEQPGLPPSTKGRGRSRPPQPHDIPVPPQSLAVFFTATPPPIHPLNPRFPLL